MAALRELTFKFGEKYITNSFPTGQSKDIRDAIKEYIQESFHLPSDAAFDLIDVNTNRAINRIALEDGETYEVVLQQEGEVRAPITYS